MVPSRNGRTEHPVSRTARAGKAEPLVSVLMVNRNHEDTLAEAISSVLSQTHRNLRLIIVDDGSTDGSVAVAEAFLADQHGPRAR